jgi:hypothetical protein
MAVLHWEIQVCKVAKEFFGGTVINISGGTLISETAEMV